MAPGAQNLAYKTEAGAFHNYLVYHMGTNAVGRIREITIQRAIIVHLFLLVEEGCTDIT